MDKEQAIILARKYKEAVAEKLPLKALYLYGSYSKGTYTEDSDIDIAVVVDYLSDNSLYQTIFDYVKIGYKAHEIDEENGTYDNYVDMIKFLKEPKNLNIR